MAKKALCVGINAYPLAGTELKGCVNDANDWADLLTTRYDFSKSRVRLLLDRRATKARIVAGLKDLLAGAAEGDVLVFTNSGHGSYLPDQDGDEPDTYDETLCPYDVADNEITDDELRELLADVPRGVRMTMISDSCHSGSVTRALLREAAPGARYRDDLRVRFMHPSLFRRVRDVPAVRDVRPRRRMAHPEAGMTHVLLTGCQDDEYSYDARIGASYHGAMTYHAIKAIRAARYRTTYAALRRDLLRRLAVAGYDQHPQLEGASAGKRRIVFT